MIRALDNTMLDGDWIIYLLKFNDGEFYVGQTICPRTRIGRWRYWHRSCATPLEFTCEVLEVGRGRDPFVAERRWIAYYRASGAKLKNAT